MPLVVTQLPSVYDKNLSLPEQSLWPLRHRPTTWQRRLCCYDASTT